MSSNMLQAPTTTFVPFRTCTSSQKKCSIKRCRLSVSCSATSQVGGKIKPSWAAGVKTTLLAGDDPLSQLVNAAIGFKPLYSVMKIAARQVIRNTAEHCGVPWRKRVKELANTPEVYSIKEELEDRSIQYPSYYLQPFHAYEHGNLGWTAAFEAESATHALAWRTLKQPELTGLQAEDLRRAGIDQCLDDYDKQQGVTSPPEQILDIGCSVGVSSRAAADRYPQAQVTGVDLSPHFLAVAEHEERTRDVSHRKRIVYRHLLAEDSGLPAQSFDLVGLHFVIHECPAAAIEDLLRESFRLLRKGGRIIVVDNNPMSPTIQNLPPVLFTLMKSTEPHSDEYFQMDLEAAMERVGFKSVITKEPNHRHRAVLGIRDC